MHFDLNVYLGRWPFRCLRYSGAAGVSKLMARTGVGQALAVPLQAVFYKDCIDGVLEMLDDIGNDRDKFFPLAIVNPNFPGWERDLRYLVEESGCVACGILPNYHGYQVYDDCSAALLKTLTEMKLPCLIFMRLWDERSHHWCMQVPPLTALDVTYILNTFPELRVAICNANLPSEGAALAPYLGDRAQTLFTTSYKSLNLSDMVELIGAEHIAYGSGAPFFYPESALQQILDADIGEHARSLILNRNACEFLNIDGGASC